MKQGKKKKPLRWVWHFHHECLAEPIYPTWGGLAERRRNIVSSKPAAERATRLRLLKYVKGRIPKVFSRLDGSSWADGKGKAFLAKLHRKECPNCPWDGHTIFPGGSSE